MATCIRSRTVQLLVACTLLSACGNSVSRSVAAGQTTITSESLDVPAAKSAAEDLCGKDARAWTQEYFFRRPISASVGKVVDSYRCVYRFGSDSLTMTTTAFTTTTDAQLYFRRTTRELDPAGRFLFGTRTIIGNPVNGLFLDHRVVIAIDGSRYSQAKLPQPSTDTSVNLICEALLEHFSTARRR